MKITKTQLKQIVKEELDAGIEEGIFDRLFGKKKEKPAEKPREKLKFLSNTVSDWYYDGIPLDDPDLFVTRAEEERMREIILFHIGVIAGRYNYADDKAEAYLKYQVERGSRRYAKGAEDADNPNRPEIDSVLGKYYGLVQIFNDTIREKKRGIRPFQMKGPRLVPNGSAYRRSSVYEQVRGTSDKPDWMDPSNNKYTGDKSGRF
tara:strand:+ start:560 stop:1174 length:615 start_codon:yes stop_codon:yes gene_type:complete